MTRLAAPPYGPPTIPTPTPMPPRHLDRAPPHAFSVEALMAHPNHQIVFSSPTTRKHHFPAISQPPTPTPTPRTIPIPEIQIAPKQPQIKAPAPTMLYDAESGEYGIRCVCQEGQNRGIMVQCELCEFWLHAVCVNVGRLRPSEPYFCPFCLGQTIQCKCGESMAFDAPLIRCTKCRMWSHKSCSNISYGIIPSNFTCSACGKAEYALPEVAFDSEYPDRFVQIELDRSDFLGRVTDGPFKFDVAQDLNFVEVGFQSLVLKYYRKYAALLFDEVPDFWKCFVDTLSALLSSTRSEILDAIDHLTFRLLYAQSAPRDLPGDSDYSYSDSLLEFMSQPSFPRFDSFPPAANLFQKSDGRVHTVSPLDDGQFVCEIPGFFMHSDEVCADAGLDPSKLSVTDTEIVIDAPQFPFGRFIRRSFHFNAIVKLIRVSDEVRGALYATRMKGPLADERGTAIAAGCEVILPFDAFLPFEIAKPEWKDKRQRVKAGLEVGGGEKRKGRGAESPKKAQKEKEKVQKEKVGFELSLLSAFTEDVIPPMPFVVLPDQKAVENCLLAKEMKKRKKEAKCRGGERRIVV